MGWKQERDSLIAQTLAFVQSVAGKKEDASRPRRAAVDLDELEASLERFAPPPLETIRTPAPVKPVIEAAVALEPAKPAEQSSSSLTRRPIVHSEMQEEIRSRIASFRAHQERFNREREEYFSATLARLKAAAKDGPASRPEK